MAGVQLWIDGQILSNQNRGLDVFERKSGKWQAVTSQTTKVQKE